MLPLDARIARLIDFGYHEFVRMSPDGFRNALSPLNAHWQAAETEHLRPEQGKIPYALVINTPALPASVMIPLITRRGKAAVERLHPISPEQFRPIKEVGIPDGHAYLLFDIDRGMGTLNVTPDEAFVTLQSQQRSPLTVEEGLALITHHPEFLQPNHCFSMLGSRCGDKRVPALWLSDGHPKLGWCWAGNPHTWLGSASCGRRSPAVKLH